jgi:hypothetical protein
MEPDKFHFKVLGVAKQVKISKIVHKANGWLELVSFRRLPAKQERLGVFTFAADLE